MEKEKLAKLLEQCPYLDVLGGLSYWDEAAEYLLANGVRLETKEATSDKTSDDPMTNGDKIRAMSDKELAEFIMLSPEMEFGVCECCEVFRGHGAYTPCGTENGWCTAELRCSAFKKWLKQPVEEV